MCTRTQEYLNKCKLYYNGKPEENELLAKYAKLAADEGSIVGMNIYAYCLEIGRGVQKDLNEALSYYTKSANGGYVDAMNNLALFYKKYNDNAENKEKAIEWYLKAAEKGSTIAFYKLAVIYETGDGTYIDMEKAAEYYKKAADNGDLESILSYAYMLNNGNGVKKDKNKAIEYYKIAATEKNDTFGKMKYQQIIKDGDEISKIRFFNDTFLPSKEVIKSIKNKDARNWKWGELLYY